MLAKNKQAKAAQPPTQLVIREPFRLKLNLLHCDVYCSSSQAPQIYIQLKTTIRDHKKYRMPEYDVTLSQHRCPRIAEELSTFVQKKAAKKSIFYHVIPHFLLCSSLSYDVMQMIKTHPRALREPLNYTKGSNLGWTTWNTADSFQPRVIWTAGNKDARLFYWCGRIQIANTTLASRHSTPMTLKRLTCYHISPLGHLELV